MSSALGSSKRPGWWHLLSFSMGIAILLLAIPYTSHIQQSQLIHLMVLKAPTADYGPGPFKHTEQPSDASSAAPLQQSYDAAAASIWGKELAALGNCGKSKHGKRYRSLAWALVRNDIHMREFVVRNLLLGFCHIVISDNNQASAGRDFNITLLLQPLCRRG